MAKTRDDVNGLLADIDRGGIMKRRALSASYWRDAERKELLKKLGEVLAILEKKAVTMGAPGEDAHAIKPRRRTNGHANGGTAARRA